MIKKGEVDQIMVHRESKWMKIEGVNSRGCHEIVQLHILRLLLAPNGIHTDSSYRLLLDLKKLPAAEVRLVAKLRKTNALF